MGLSCSLSSTGLTGPSVYFQYLTEMPHLANIVLETVREVCMLRQRMCLLARRGTWAIASSSLTPRRYRLTMMSPRMLFAPNGHQDS